MNLTRREMIGSSAAALAGTTLLNQAFASPVGSSALEQKHGTASDLAQTVHVNQPLVPGKPGKDYHPVITPNNNALPWKIVDGVKVYHLIAEPVFHEFAPGLKAHCWGYNGHVPGPTIEAVEGEHVRIYVTNKLPEATTVHWHGILLPNGMDGVGGVTQRAIRPGETFCYEFTLRQFGTYMYHSHQDGMVQEAMGLSGLFIIHPRQPQKLKIPRPQRDFAILLQEWKIDPGTYRIDPYEMTDFNIFTMNGRCFPGTHPLAVRQDQRTRIRFGNLSAMDHHPIHLHGFQFMVVGTGGAAVNPGAQHGGVTTLVGVGQTRDIQFIADAPGDWVMHCHMTHHTMNQMGHGAANMTGVDARGMDKKIQKLLPGYMTMGTNGMGQMSKMKMPLPPNTIPMGDMGPYGPTMGGMFTILKVREHISDQALAGNVDPGWYQHPKGTEVQPATAEQLRHDGIQT